MIAGTPRSGAIASLIPYMRPHFRGLSAVFVMTVAIVAVEIAQPWIVKEAIDHYLSAPLPDALSLARMALLYFVLVLVAFGLAYWQEILLQRIGVSIVRSIRIDLFRHLQELSLAYFDRNGPGRIITNVVSDTEALNNFFTQFLSNTLRGGFLLLLIMLSMAKLDLPIALSCFSILPVVTVAAYGFQRKIQSINAEVRHRLGLLIGFLAENLDGMTIVQICHQEEKQRRRFDERNQVLLKATIRENRWFMLFFNVTELLADLVIAALVWFAGRGVIEGTISFGVLYAFVGYLRRFFQPINIMSQQMNILQSSIVASQRIAMTLAEQPDILQHPGVETPKLDGAVTLEEVSLAYLPGRNVLHGITLSIRAGERVGFVGVTGAGKSSIMNLITRFYDVTGGRVLIDGTDIRQWPREALRRTVGIVQQEVTLFSGTVVDNVRFFQQAISEDRVREACRLVGAEPFILRLPRGYATELSEKGSVLSAGERQLLSFARVLIFNPRILILDEATSCLDSRTEEMLQTAIRKVSSGRTMLVIAHRLSTVQEMDTICVLENGRIVESGAPAELLGRQGYYWRLHQSRMLLGDVA